MIVYSTLKNYGEENSMPTYEYRCEKCEHEFELFQSITAEPKAECPECGENSKRLISSGAGIIFKGSGFYVNDYKKKEAPCSNSNSSTQCQSCPSSQKN